ncbi:hypothetical protein KBC04_00025 [Candidatus Babeliales bacterium]|nr:hypothetical protein [Candidatus Babeliales bacterium]MBP9843520.1 hypothetical protein [Candidatus Babeliales bacterium]
MKKINMRLTFLFLFAWSFLATASEEKQTSPKQYGGILENQEKEDTFTQCFIPADLTPADGKETPRMHYNSPDVKEAWGQEKPRRRQSLFIPTEEFDKFASTTDESTLSEKKQEDRRIIQTILKIRSEDQKSSLTPPVDTSRPASRSIDEEESK